MSQQTMKRKTAYTTWLNRMKKPDSQRVFEKKKKHNGTQLLLLVCVKIYCYINLFNLMCFTPLEQHIIIMTLNIITLNQIHYTPATPPLSLLFNSPVSPLASQ